VYAVSYATSYLDEAGAVVPTALRAARVTPQSTTFLRAAQSVDANGRTVQVRLWDAAGAATDGTFLLEVQ
jgi:hypothetical protein